jgi:hypothetical protein
MIRYFCAVLFSAVLATGASAQFRTDAEQAKRASEASNTLGAMTSDESSFFSELFNKDRWSMHQSYSFSYSTMGSQSVGLSMFTNTVSYKASDDLFVSADVSAVYSPFNSLGDNFSKQINGIYLSNARLDWKLSDETFLRVEYVGGPSNNYGYSPFGNTFGSSMQNSPFPNKNGWQTTSATVTK